MYRFCVQCSPKNTYKSQYTSIPAIFSLQEIWNVITFDAFIIVRVCLRRIFLSWQIFTVFKTINSKMTNICLVNILTKHCNFHYKLLLSKYCVTNCIFVIHFNIIAKFYLYVILLPSFRNDFWTHNILY